MTTTSVRSRSAAARSVQRTVDHSPALSQQFAPVREKLGVVVLTHGMRFEARPNVDMHAVGILSGRGRNTQGIGARLRPGQTARARKTPAAMNTRCRIVIPNLVQVLAVTDSLSYWYSGFSESVSQRLAGDSARNNCRIVPLRFLTAVGPPWRRLDAGPREAIHFPGPLPRYSSELLDNLPPAE